MNFFLRCAAVVLVCQPVLAVPPPETQLVTPTELITAEAFDRPESLPAKGQPGWHGGIGEWRIEGGVLTEKDEKPSEKRPNGHEAVCEHVTEAGDVVITAEFKLGGSPQVGFVCRDTLNPNNHLGRVLITPKGLSLLKMSGISKETRREVLQTIETPMDPDAWHSILIEISGDRWQARVGPHLLSARHERFKDLKGRIGMVARGEGAQFRNVAVWKAKPKA
jgi:hypothetical protein